MERKKLSIIPYTPELAPHFARLNRAWIEEYYHMEPIDEYVLGNPEEAIISHGGKIFFARYGDEIVGTVALKPHPENILELTKMAVDKTAQGVGAGKLLCETAIAESRKMGAKQLVLYCHSKLSAAMAVYNKCGFKDIPLEPGKYERADVKLGMDL